MQQERFRSRDAYRRGLVVALVVFLVALLVGGVWFYFAEERRVRAAVYSELESIEELKVGEIARWREDRLAESGVIGRDPTLGHFLIESRGASGTVESTPVADWLASTAQGLLYSGIVVLDADLNVILQTDGAHTDFAEEAQERIRTVLEGGPAVLTELHRAPGQQVVHIGAIAPVVDPRNPQGEPLAAVVVQIDANEFLYPLVESWPTRSATAETLLVRRDGSDALFLNDLRHQAGAALELRIPPSDSEVAAVMALKGVTGVVEATDYRDVPILAAIQPIPDSPWYMIAKVDMEEAFSAWRTRAILIVLVVLGMALLAAATVGILWQRTRADSLHELLAVERSRRESEARYEATLLSVGDGVVVTDAECRVTLLNPVAEQLTGWTIGEARGLPVEDVFKIVNEDTLEPVENPVRAVCRADRVVGLANHSVLLSRDGQARPIADSGAPVHDDGGALVGIVLVFRDQTEERASRNAITRTNERLERAEQHALLGSWEMDPVTGEGWWSTQMYRLVGIDPHAGMPTFDEYVEHVHPHDRDKVRGALEAMVAAREPVVSQFRTDPARGPVRVLSPTVHIERDAGGVIVAISGTVLDVTGFYEAQQEILRLNESLEATVDERTEELMAATEELQSANEELMATNEELHTTAEEVISVNERLTEASEAKTRFLRAMSHELRTPLNSIIGFSDVMARGLAGEVNPEQKRQLDMIHHSGGHLLALINDILDLSRIEAGRVDINMDMIDAGSLASSVLDAVSGQARAKGLALEFEVLDGPIELMSDPRRVEQILFNLIGNAVKFTQEGSVSLTIAPSGEGLVSFSVRDTGPGVALDDQERVFGEFAQVELHHNGDQQGTGLGLAISRGLAQILGGSISLSSRVGIGSTFTLVLPVSRLDD